MVTSPRNKLAFCLSLVCLIGVASAYLPYPELLRLCNQRTGLTSRDFSDRHTRNENCAVDCITKQGTVMTAHADDGTGCHDNDGYRCVLGKCRSPDDKLVEESKLELNQIDISVKSAFVADRDPYPGQGESDAFVVVELVSEGEPAYNAGDLVCHTHVVQDNSRPKWNFNCRLLPLKGAAKLRFAVYDSDKPDTEPQLLGVAIKSVESLMNGGLQSLTLEQAGLSGGPYHLEVEVRGKRYTPSE